MPSMGNHSRSPLVDSNYSSMIIQTLKLKMDWILKSFLEIFHIHSFNSWLGLYIISSRLGFRNCGVAQR